MRGRGCGLWGCHFSFLNFEIESCDILYCYCVYFYWLYGFTTTVRLYIDCRLARQLTHDQIEKYGQNSQEPSPMQLQIVGELTFVTRAVVCRLYGFTVALVNFPCALPHPGPWARLPVTNTGFQPPPSTRPFRLLRDRFRVHCSLCMY